MEVYTILIAVKSSISCGCSIAMFDDTRRLWTIKRSDFVTEHDFTSQKLRKVEASRSWEFHNFWNLAVFWGAQPSKVRGFYGISSFKKLKDHTCTIGRVHPCRKVGSSPSKNETLASKKETWPRRKAVTQCNSVLCWSSWTPIILMSFFHHSSASKTAHRLPAKTFSKVLLPLAETQTVNLNIHMQPKIGAWHSLTSTNWDCNGKTMQRPRQPRFWGKKTCFQWLPAGWISFFWSTR